MIKLIKFSIKYMGCWAHGVLLMVLAIPGDIIYFILVKPVIEHNKFMKFAARRRVKQQIDSMLESAAKGEPMTMPDGSKL